MDSDRPLSIRCVFWGQFRPRREPQKGRDAVSAVVVVGAQWGDEAKGKVVDLLAQYADVVVRYAGGSNAGHTVMVGDFLLKLHLIPSGILNPRTQCIISDGVVLDPTVLTRELAGLREQRVSTENLKISLNAHVVMPYHKELDRLEEEAKGDGKIGTTMQGVGPAYEDKARRCGIRIADLVDPERLQECLSAVLPHKNFLLEQKFGSKPFRLDEILEEYAAYGREIHPYIADTGILVYEAVRHDERVVFEGAQGTMLDIDYGTYPFVTSSHPVAGGACLGTGVGPKAIDTIIGVCKAYTTRVGAGSFPTELDNELGERIRKRGNEYGTTTGRPRRVGWLDVVGLRYAARVNGLDWLALTLLDVLSGFPEVKICTGYDFEGQLLEELPADRRILSGVAPVYETIPGWTEEISDVTRFDRLPRNAQAYVRRVEELLKVPCALVSVGRRREETIILEPGVFQPEPVIGATRIA
jgi:adenylosuccinate synthase